MFIGRFDTSLFSRGVNKAWLKNDEYSPKMLFFFTHKLYFLIITLRLQCSNNI